MNEEIPLALSYDDVLLVPQYSRINSRNEVDLSSQISPHIKLSLPLTTAPMTSITDQKMAIEIGKLGGLGFIPRFNSPEQQAGMIADVKKENVLVGAAVGCKDGYLERAEMLIKAGTDALLLDVTHGHMQRAIDTTKILKRKFGKFTDIMSGLVATGEGAEQLFRAGADCVHIGIGGGSICITRIVTGVGVPNITTVLDCARVARKYKKTIISDGGIKNSGDVVKALAAGCSAIRGGNIFAGTKEAPGRIVRKNGKVFKSYNGTTSYSEKLNHLKEKAATEKHYINHIEGVESIVVYKGPLADILTTYQANLRAGFSYCGAKNLEELWQKAKFVKITSMGLRESNVHDVSVI